MEIQKSLDAPLDQMKLMLKSLATRFHERHYLLILIKKHILAIDDNLVEMTKEDLKERLKLCEEILIVLNIINPGRNTDRGTALRQKAETKKMLLKRLKMADEIGDEDFMEQVQKCVMILGESQDCMSMKIKVA